MSNNRVMETVVKLAGSIDPSLAKSIKTAEENFKKMDKSVLVTKASMIAFGAAAVTATVAIGKQLYELGAQFDEAFDTIRIGTGATGEALETLKDDFKEVYKSVPGTMEEASKAIADYNTRLGLTGEELRGISKQAIAVSKMLGEDLNTTIESSSQTLQQWGIDSKDMGKQMDYIFKVSQSTGIGFNELMTNMQSYGPQLQEMGYSFEQAGALIGQMEKAGVNTTEVLAAMKKSVGTLAKEGISASAGMQIYYEKIKNAGTAAEATAIANEVFGMRAGSTVANAIKKGTLSVDAFTKSLENNGETIIGAMKDTMDAKEKWELLIKEVTTAIEPLASAVFDLVGSCIPIVATLLNVVTPILKLLADHANVLIPIIMGVVAALGSLSVIETVVGLMNVLKASTIATTLANGGLLASLQAIWVAIAANPIALAIGALVAGIALLVMNWDKVTAAAQKFWEMLKGFGNFIKDHFIDILLGALGPLGLIINGIRKITGLKSSAKATEDIPAYATGGFTNGLSIAGEAGTEAIISFDPAYRAKNIDIWQRAGELLGAGTPSGNSYNLGGFTFSPNLYISESMSADDVINKLKSAEGEFCDMIDDWMARKTAGSYTGTSYAY